MRIDETATIRRSVPGTNAAELPLVVVLHGYGAHERDLLPLWEHLGFPGETVFLRAPQPLGPTGWMWFPISTIEAPDVAAVQEAADLLLEWLDEHAAGRDVITIGFSQGGTVAIQALRTDPERFRGIVVLSGFVAEVQGDDALLAGHDVPAFFGHGDRDQVIPPIATQLTSRWLGEHTRLTERSYPGLGHGVDPAEVLDVRKFLAQLT